MRVPPKPLGSYPFYLRPFFWNQRRKYGEVLQAALLWARAPKLFAAVALLYGMIDRRSSPIDPALRSLVTVRVSQINTCSFCVDLNSATLIKRGVSLEKVEALETWRQSNLFDQRERLISCGSLTMLLAMRLASSIVRTWAVSASALTT